MNELRSFYAAYTRTGPLATPAGTNLPSVTVTASAANAFSAKLPGADSNNGLVQIHIANKTDKWAHINFGVLGAVTAATVNNFPVAPVSAVVVSVDPEVTGAAVILDGAPGTATSVIFTRGSGISS